MSTGPICAAPIATSIPNTYADHKSEYIPNTSPWSSRLTCELVSPDDTEALKMCCSGVKTIERAIDKAFKHGVQSHPGIDAIKDFPCVTQGEMSRLSNDLEKAIKARGITMDIPDGLDTSRPAGHIGRSLMQYCREVVFDKLSRELGRAYNSPPIAFSKDILKYCQQAIALRPHPQDPSLYTGW
jgi:hypothetical protein